MQESETGNPKEKTKRRPSSGARDLVARWEGLGGSRLTPEDRNIRLLYLDTASGGVVSAGVYTFLPVFLVRLGASSLWVSLLTSLPAILMAVLILPAGLLVQRQRDLVRFTTWGRVLHRLFFLLFPLAPFLLRDHLVETMVVLWALKAIPEAFINLSWTGAMAEVVPARRRPSVNGNRWALMSLASAVSVAAFGYLLERLAFPVSYQIVFFVSFLTAAASIYLFGSIKLPVSGGSSATEGDVPPGRPSSGSKPAQRHPLIQRLREYVAPLVETPVFLRYLATTFVLRLGIFLPEALYSVYWIRQLGASDAWIGWQATAGSLALVVGYFVWGRVATRKGHYLVLVVCTVGMGVYPLLTGLITAPVWLPVVALVRGVFFTGINIAFFDILLQVSPVGTRPSFVAVYYLSGQAASFLAPIAGSLLAEWLNIRAVFFFASGIHLLAVLLFRLFPVTGDEEQVTE